MNDMHDDKPKHHAPRRKEKSFFEGDPRMLFAFGLVTGIALTLIFGGGISLPKAGAAAGSDKVVREFDAPAVDAGSGSAPVGTLAPVTADEHILGDINKAKVVLVEYSDFECPFCGRHHPTMQNVMDKYGDEIAWVWRHFPLSFHQEAIPSALASECAADQGKFWEYGDRLIEEQSNLSEDLYFELASEVGLDINEFTDCYESEKFADDVSQDQSSGAAAGVQGTPATFVNGQLISGAVPQATFEGIIDGILAE
jgi:protein-disulfide isomerase